MQKRDDLWCFDGYKDLHLSHTTVGLVWGIDMQSSEDCVDEGRVCRCNDWCMTTILMALIMQDWEWQGGEPFYYTELQ